MRSLGKSMAAQMLAALATVTSSDNAAKTMPPRAAKRGSIMHQALPMVHLERYTCRRPRKTLYTFHKNVGRSCYRPHQGSQERLRRWKQMEKQRGDAS